MTSNNPPIEAADIPLDDAVVARIDALAPLFSPPGRKATRSDVLERLTLDALERVEKDPQLAEAMRDAVHERRRR